MKSNEITQLILEESRELEHVLNDDMLKRFGKLHNVKDEQNRLNLKQEVVARWGYFLTVKKKYALHITNMEGVEVDELQTKGLITRRSDYPSLTKEKVGDLINMLVMEEKLDVKKLRDYVESSQILMRTLCAKGDKRIARPVTYSKEKKTYKKIPYHFAGMDLWNLLEYEYFVAGTKGYLFKIQGIEWDKAPKTVKEHRSTVDSLKKLQYIVLPYEEEKLPDYFIIDVDAMLEFAWITRAKELLEPIEHLIYKTKKTNNTILTF
jgi:hypothetical protein